MATPALALLAAIAKAIAFATGHFAQAVAFRTACAPPTHGAFHELPPPRLTEFHRNKFGMLVSPGRYAHSSEGVKEIGESWGQGAILGMGPVGWVAAPTSGSGRKVRAPPGSALGNAQAG